MTDLSPSGVLLPGIGMGGYRSLFGLQSLGPLRKVTLIAGQNNTGKSNILRFASLLLTTPVPQFQWADEPQPPGPPLQLQLAYPLLTLERLESLNISDPASFMSVFDSKVFQPCDGDNVWLTYSCEGAKAENRRWGLDEQFLIDATAQAAEAGLGSVVNRASSALTGTSGGPEGQDMRRVLEKMFPFAPPAVETVGAFRQIAEASPSDLATSSVEDFSGRDLVRRLARLANPSAERYALDRARFDAINQFAQTVLQDNDVEIRIAADQNEIQVHQGSRVFPLSSLGTGIHQVIILATAASLLENTLVCIEEPEVFLHPVLQRKLVRYLSEVTTNQYLIATHSAHMLDYERACVLHVTHDPVLGTSVTRAQSLQAVSDLCGDLGYRPSDLIQANAVIWVEGPSDRVYMNHWLQMVAGDEFIEGIHYSVMFYGGSLLRYLTADDPSVGDFISLRRLNRHSAILIDSDKKNSRARLNETKVRVINEFARQDMPGFAWVTDGRTIESYVPIETLTEAIGAIHRRSRYEAPADKWADPLQIVGKEGNSVQADKVKIARDACERWPGGQLTANLREQVSRVVDFIRTANGSVGRLPHEPARP
jgi:predicted ATPase